MISYEKTFVASSLCRSIWSGTASYVSNDGRLMAATVTYDEPKNRHDDVEAECRTACIKRMIKDLND